MTTKKLNRRQARWAEFLAEFDFKIAYQAGKKNDKADSLTRRPGDKPASNEDIREKHMYQTLLPSEKFHLFDKVKISNQEDETCRKIKEAVRRKERSFEGMLLKKFTVVENVLFFRNKLWVPKSDELKLTIIREIHDQPSVGHPGFRRTLFIVKKLFYWLSMRDMIARYIRNCHVCRRSKAPREKYSGLLQPLPVPERPWVDISMDFVIGLPSSGKDKHNAILMVVDRLTKMHHYIPCTAEEEGTSAEEKAHMLLKNVWKLHGLFEIIIIDRGPQFVALV